VALAFALLLTAGAVPKVQAEETESTSEGPVKQIFDAIVGGKPILDVNFRWENAKADTFQTSNALTVRTRLGYQTRPLYGISGLLEFVNVASPLPSGYFDGVEDNDTLQTIVADPNFTGANRFWLAYEKPAWADLKLKTGRQRILLDDNRWVGNVGWRQNEQTFDAVRFESSLGIDGLLAQYVFAWEVNRIFGDQGPANRRDFGTQSHFINLGYGVAEWMEAVGFVYLIDSHDPFDLFGSQTFGVRFTGSSALSESLSTSYQASYAYQENAANNATDYEAHYLMLEGAMKLKGVAGVAVGYEVLGSDDGKAVIVTPYATAHKFNGFADVFLTNGDARGLRDVYVSLSPSWQALTDRFSFKFIFHQFYDDKGGDNLGQEYDLVTTYQFNQYVGLLYKFAYFDGGKSRSPNSTMRSFLQATLKY
jgi:hypothetical protein